MIFFVRVILFANTIYLSMQFFYHILHAINHFKNKSREQKF